jgi:zinc transport system permease protein
VLADLGHDAGAGTGSGVDDAELAELEAVLGTPPAQSIATPEVGPTWAEFVDGWELFRDAVLAGGFAGAALGFLSVYVVLRRMVFVSAAVTQSAGLGVALSFYAAIHLGVAIDPLWGAIALSLVTAAILTADPKRLGLSREMVLGLLFASTSGAAVLVGSRITQEAHDIQAILFGTAVAVSTDDMHHLAWSGALVVGVQLWMMRGFAFASFDPLAARVQRLPTRLLDLILLLSVGALVGEAARALGALPAFAMSTLPGMAALLLVRGPLPLTFAVAALLGAAAGVVGYLVAFFHEFPVGSAQTVTAAVIVVVALVVRLAVTAVVTLVRRGRP